MVRNFQQMNGQDNQLIKPIIDLIKAEKYHQAEAKASALRRQLPANVQLMILHGDAYRSLKNFDNAVACYEQALAAGNKSVALILNLASSLNQVDQSEKAMSVLSGLSSQQLNQASALSIMGDSLKKLNRLPEAIECFQKAQKKQPDNPKVYMALAELSYIENSDLAIKVLESYLQSDKLDIQEQAGVLATIAKIYLDSDDNETAFDYYSRANKLIDESLPPAKVQLESLLNFSRCFYPASLFKRLSQYGLQSRPQIIIAGMSRSGKSRVESLFHGVKGVDLAGEELVLRDFRRDLQSPYNNKIENWLSSLTPESINKHANEYLQRLNPGENVKITTVPGDLWNLGLIGLFAPNVPIIFCVRSVLDLGVTGYFQQYKFPEGYRYSYNLHAIGRQIAIFEKIMEHWTQVLPNPIYLVDYEALVQDPAMVMNNLLNQLELEREQSYEEIIEANREVSESIGPVVSFDAPMPITKRFLGFGNKFRNKLQPMIDGYEEIVKQFPRVENATTIMTEAPSYLYDSDKENQRPSEKVVFNWKIPGQIMALDNGGQVIKHTGVQVLVNNNALSLVIFDPLGDIELPELLQNEQQVQIVSQSILGDGKHSSYNVCLEAAYNSTLQPVAQSSLPIQLRNKAAVITQLPIANHSLDNISGLNSLDWLLLGTQSNALAVLENGASILKNTLLIEITVLFQPIYEGQASFAEIMHWAARNGFALHRIVSGKDIQAMDRQAHLLKQPDPSLLLAANLVLVPSQQRLDDLSDTQLLKLAFILDSVYKVHDLSFTLLSKVGVKLGDNYLKARGYYDRRQGGPSYTEIEEIRSCLLIGNINKALNKIKVWLKTYPQDARVTRLAAILSTAIGNTQQAIRNINRSVKTDPNDIAGWLSAGHILLDSGYWWEAETVCQQLLDIEPNNPEIKALFFSTLAANFKPDLEQVEQALADIEPILLNTEDVIERANLLSSKAGLLAHKGLIDESITLFYKALDLLSDINGIPKARILNQMSDCLLMNGNINLACEMLWEACCTRPYSYFTYKANHKLIYNLPKTDGSDSQNIGDLHQRVQQVWLNYQSDEIKYLFGDFDLSYQAFEPLKLAGTRPAMYRLGIYGLDQYLPKNAKALDIGCNHGYLLMGLADKLSYGYGFDISQSCIDVGKLVAEHLGYDHIELECKTFDEFRTRKKFDLVIACAVHKWIGMDLSRFGSKLHEFCAKDGILLLETQGKRETDATERNYEEKFNTIAKAGFEVIHKGSICDDAINYREFWVLRRV